MTNAGRERRGAAALGRFLRGLGPDPSATLRAAAEACARAVLEQDVSMNVYAGARSEPKPWPLDVVPLP